jgi:8-oxo-dGTP pyrophosphatase MutT (NUDIX family)
MAANEPTGTPAPQGDKAHTPTPKKRRRRRRPRRKPGASTSAAGSGAKAKKVGRPEGGSKGSAGSGTRGGGAGGKGRTRGGKKRGGAKRSSTAKTQGDRSKQAAKRGARRPKIPTTREVSAGGVVYRRGHDGIEVVLASRRTRRGQLAWGLAKGGLERGETKEVAAIREVREETGMTAEIEADLGDTKYMYVWDDIRIRKTVHFFLMRHTGGNVEDRDDEMEEIRWFPLERAIKRAAYRGERDMLVKASELLA